MINLQFRVSRRARAATQTMRYNTLYYNFTYNPGTLHVMWSCNDRRPTASRIRLDRPFDHVRSAPSHSAIWRRYETYHRGRERPHRPSLCPLSPELHMRTSLPLALQVLSLCLYRCLCVSASVSLSVFVSCVSLSQLSLSRSLSLTPRQDQLLICFFNQGKFPCWSENCMVEVLRHRIQNIIG